VRDISLDTPGASVIVRVRREVKRATMLDGFAADDVVAGLIIARDLLGETGAEDPLCDCVDEEVTRGERGADAGLEFVGRSRERRGCGCAWRRCARRCKSGGHAGMIAYEWFWWTG